MSNMTWILFGCTIAVQIIGMYISVWASKQSTRREDTLQKRLELSKVNARWNRSQCDRLIDELGSSMSMLKAREKAIDDIYNLVTGMDLWKYATPREKEEFWQKFNAITGTQEGGQS